MIRPKQIAGTSGRWNVRNVTHADSPVTAAPDDWIRCNTSGGDIQVNGPETAGVEWGTIKVSTLDENNVSISCIGGGLIADMATQSNNVPFFAFNVIGNGSGGDIH